MSLEGYVFNSGHIGFSQTELRVQNCKTRNNQRKQETVDKTNSRIKAPKNCS